MEASVNIPKPQATESELNSNSQVTINGCSELNEPSDYIRPPSKRYVEALLQRIERLEEQCALLQAGRSLSDSVETKASPNSGSENDQLISSLAESADSLQRRDPASELADTLGRLNIGEDGQLRHYGGRSNFHLVQGLLEMPSNRSAETMQQRGEAMAKFLALDFNVSDELRDHLLGYFWNWQNISQYIVPQTLFLRDMHTDFSGKYASKLLLLAMLAVASRYSDRLELRTDPSDPNTAGRALAEQAKVMLYSEIEAPTLCTIQAATLLSVYETSVDKEGLSAIYLSASPALPCSLGNPDMSCIQIWRREWRITLACIWIVCNRW